MGSCVMPVKTTPGRSSAMICFASLDEKAGTSSCSIVSALTYGGGSRSLRTDALWPILMKAGPSSTSRLVSSLPRASAFLPSRPSPDSTSASSLPANPAEHHPISRARVKTSLGRRP